MTHFMTTVFIHFGTCCAILLIASAMSFAADSPDVREWLEMDNTDNLNQIVDLYKHFHRNPELSFQEEQTAARVAKELKQLGMEVTTNVGGHGVVGMLKNGDGPTVMVRTDLDALPVEETTGLPYASTVHVEDESGAIVGVMHACGHDIHIANLIGVARYMAEHRNRWSGTLMFVAQPAEERGAGAAAMLEDGLFRDFAMPNFALALHVDPNLRAGFIGYRAGHSMANVDSVDITLNGRGGHGAYPHGTVDPIVMAAHLIVDLQTIVSREISPLDPAVVTVGSIHGGTKHNVIPDTCHLQLTVRSYSGKVREHLWEAIERKTRAIAKSFRGGEPTIKITEGTPSLSNNEALVNRIVPAFQNALGPSNVMPVEPTMGGEDFSRYGLAGVPIFMFRLGSVSPARLDEFTKKGTNPPSLHSAEYYPEPRETLRTGITAMTAALEELLGG